MEVYTLSMVLLLVLFLFNYKALSYLYKILTNLTSLKGYLIVLMLICLYLSIQKGPERKSMR